MPHILVVEGKRVFMDEEVQPVHLNEEHSAVQLLERLQWAIEDADRRRNRRGPRTVRRRPDRYTAVPRS